MAIEGSLIKSGEWIVHQAIIFDWYNGPRHGVCAFKVPRCEFVFDLFAERFNPDGMDDRLLVLRELPDESLQRIISEISCLGEPSSSVWIPVWKFSTENKRRHADEIIDTILDSSIQTNIILWTRNLEEVLGAWKITNLNTSEPVEWFSRLNI